MSNTVVGLNALKQVASRLQQETSSSGGTPSTQPASIPVIGCEYDNTDKKYVLSLNNSVDTINIRFSPSQPYIIGEYVEIEGSRYDIRPKTGNLKNGMWKANQMVTGELDTVNKILFVDVDSSGGGYQVDDVIFTNNMAPQYKHLLDATDLNQVVIFENVGNLVNYSTLGDGRLICKNYNNNKICVIDVYQKELKYCDIDPTIPNLLPDSIIGRPEGNSFFIINSEYSSIYEIDLSGNQIREVLNSDVPEGISEFRRIYGVYDNQLVLYVSIDENGTTENYIVSVDPDTFQILSRVSISSLSGDLVGVTSDQIITHTMTNPASSNYYHTFHIYDRTTGEEISSYGPNVSVSSSSSVTYGRCGNRIIASVSYKSGTKYYTSVNMLDIDFAISISSAVRLNDGFMLFPSTFTSNDNWYQFKKMQISDYQNKYDTFELFSTVIPPDLSISTYDNKFIYCTGTSGVLVVFGQIDKYEILA